MDPDYSSVALLNKLDKHYEGKFWRRPHYKEIFRRVAEYLTPEEAKDVRNINPSEVANRYMKARGVSDATRASTESALRNCLSKFIRETDKSVKLGALDDISGVLLEHDILEKGTPEYWAASVLILAMHHKTISANKLAKHLKGKISRKEVRAICKRFRDNRIFITRDDGSKAIQGAWHDPENGWLAFIMDAMVGAGKLEKQYNDDRPSRSSVNIKDFSNIGVKSGGFDG